MKKLLSAMIIALACTQISAAQANTFTLSVEMDTSLVNTQNPMIDIWGYFTGPESTEATNVGTFFGVQDPATNNGFTVIVDFIVPVDSVVFFDQFSAIYDDEECGTESLPAGPYIYPNAEVGTSVTAPTCKSLRNYSFKVFWSDAIPTTVSWGTTKKSKADAIAKVFVDLGFSAGGDICKDSGCSGGQKCLPVGIKEQGTFAHTTPSGGQVWMSNSEISIRADESDKEYHYANYSDATEDANFSFDAKLSVMCDCVTPTDGL